MTEESQDQMENLELEFESSEKIEEVKEEEEEDSNFELGEIPTYLKGITDKTLPKEGYDDITKEIESKTLIAKLQIISKIRNWFGLPRLKEEPAADQVETHIFNSMERLMTLLQDCNDSVSNVRVAALKSESMRLKKERMMRAILLKELEKEHKIASLKYKSINKDWEKIKSLNDPLDIHNATNQQRDKCVALLERKDAVIEKLKKIIKKADNIFLEDLGKYENEVNILIDRIDEQLTVIANAYRKELELIEAVNAKEKEDRLKVNRERWDKFIGEKNEIEREIVEQRFQLMEQHEEKLDNFILDCQESLREMTIEYYKKIRELIMKVEEMRGTCDLNAQKLKFNYILLQKREEENRTSRKHMLHKLSDLKEKLDILKTEIQNEKKRLEAKLNKLKNELKFYAREITVVDKRADSLAHANNKKYFQLWDYNNKIADDLIKNILEVERLFYEQQLCIPWNEPETKSFSKESLPSYMRAKSIVSLEMTQNDPERERKMELYRKAIQEELTPEEAERRQRLMRIIFEKIADNAGYLREDKLETFMAEIPEGDKTLIRVEQVFKALGVTSNEDMLMLTKFLMPYLHCKICDFKLGEDAAYFMEKDTKFKDDLSDMASMEEEDRDILSEMTRSYISRFQATCDVVYKEFCDIDNGKQDNLAIDYETKQLEKPKITSSTEKEDIKRFHFEEELMMLPIDVEDKQHLLDVIPTDNELISCKVHSHELVMPTINVIKALKNFMVDFHNVRKEIRQNYVDYVVNKKRLTISRLIDNKEVEEFWNKYKTFFGQERQEMWNTFHLAMTNYIHDLRKRHKLNEDIRKIKKTNSELRRLLVRYLEPRRNISIFDSIVEKVDEAMEASTSDS